MILQHDLLRLLDQALGLDGRGLSFEPQTRLTGALPELDPMGVVALPTALEDRFGLSIADDEIDASGRGRTAAVILFGRSASARDGAASSRRWPP